MNYRSDSGYEVLYPETLGNISYVGQNVLTAFEVSGQYSVDDILAIVPEKIITLGRNVAIAKITLKTTKGNFLAGFSVDSVKDINGNLAVSDSSGLLSGYIDVSSMPMNIGVTGYTDINDYQEQVNLKAGEVYQKQWNLTIVNYKEFSSSGTVRFSSNVSQLGVCVVGGGGGGGKDTVGAPGGGGGYSVINNNISFTSNQDIPFTVGAGGAGMTQVSTSAGNGGTSSFLSLSANGGGGAGRRSAGIGDGNGGERQAEEGADGNRGGFSSGHKYSGFNSVRNSGGGGGGGAYAHGNRSASYDGGAGGYMGGDGGGALISGSSSQNAYSGTNGDVGGGGGGGGGCAYNTNTDDYTNGNGGDGGSGCVCFRMTPKAT